MLECCVSGCKNRYRPGSKFYTIPSGSRPFQVKRRHLWIQAIQRANGSSMDFTGNPRICGDHFISGQASMDQDRPNFVPSVFPCAKRRQGPKKNIKPGRSRHRAKVDTEEETCPKNSDGAEMVETEGGLSVQTPSPPSLRKKIRGLTEEARSEINTMQSQTASSPNTTSLVGIRKRAFGYRRKARRRAKADTEEETCPKNSDGAEMVETEGGLSVQTPSPPSLRKKIRGLTEEAGNETNTMQSQTASSPNTTSLVGIRRRSSGYRRRLRGRAKANAEEETSPSDSDGETEFDLSVQTPSPPSLRKKIRGLTAEAGRETNTMQSSSPNTSLVGIRRRSSGYRRRLRRRAKADTEDETSPSDSDGADIMEAEWKFSVQTPSPPSLRKKIRGKTKEANTMQSQTASSPNTSQVGMEKMDKMNPVVVLKTVITPEGGFRCELCSQTFIGVLQFVKHKQQHEEPEAVVSDQTDEADPPLAPKDEPSFQCNMCDRSFTSSSDLKRHKLLHVKDARKCFKCGVLFCRRHNHVFIQPQIESKASEDSEDESSTAEEQNADTDVSREQSLPESVEPEQMAETAEDTQSSFDVSPTASPSPSPAASSRSIPPLSTLTRYPGMKSEKPSPMPRPPSPILRLLNNPKRSFKPHMPDYPSVFVQPHLPQHPELPPSLKLFSPQYLTSAFLEVQRDYKFILSKPRKIKQEKVVKTEPNEPVWICPEVKPVKEVKKEKIAYDIEIEI